MWDDLMMVRCPAITSMQSDDDSRDIDRCPWRIVCAQADCHRSTNTLSNHHLGVHLVPCHQRPNVALDYSASDSSERANRNLQGYSK